MYCGMCSIISNSVKMTFLNTDYAKDWVVGSMLDLCINSSYVNQILWFNKIDIKSVSVFKNVLKTTEDKILNLVIQDQVNVHTGSPVFLVFPCFFLFINGLLVFS